MVFLMSIKQNYNFHYQPWLQIVSENRVSGFGRVGFGPFTLNMSSMDHGVYYVLVRKSVSTMR